MPHKPKGGFTHGGPRPGAGAPKTVIKLKKGQMLELMPPVALNGNGGEVSAQTFMIVHIEEDTIWLRNANPAADQEPIKLAITDPPESVSYTHLDVYKRQTHRRTTRQLELETESKQPCLTVGTAIPKPHTSTATIARNANTSARPDVYKRQLNAQHTSNVCTQ